MTVCLWWGFFDFDFRDLGVAEEERAVRVDAEATNEVPIRDGAAEEFNKRGTVVGLGVALVLFTDATTLVETGKLIPVE